MKKHLLGFQLALVFLFVSVVQSPETLWISLFTGGYPHDVPCQLHIGPQTFQEGLSQIMKLNSKQHKKQYEMKTYIIDAFTDQPFSGNPAAVCILESEMSDETLQAIANEINLSETAFIKQIGDIENGFSIRFFTPTVEIEFCGHATLAAAKFVHHLLGTTLAQFITKKGLTLKTASLGQDIELHFPLYNTAQIVPNQDLLEAFGIVNPVAVKFNKDLDMLLIEVKDKKTLTGLCPDFRKAKEITGRIKEVVVTTLSKEKEFDFYSRCFCPWIGINEDSVTGAAHSVLAKYWGDLLGKTKMNAYQSSKRGGFMKLHILNNNSLRVYGKAVIVFEGKMVIDQYKNPLD